MIYDYDGILTELKNRLSLLSNWATISYHGTYERILSVIAYIIDKLVYLAEFLYVESNWMLAQKVGSLMTQVELLSYNPHRKRGAVGTVQMSAIPYTDLGYSTNVYTGDNIIIPQWTELLDDTSEVTVYTTVDTIYYKNTTGPIDVDVKEGIPKEFLYVAAGTANENIKLYSDTSDEDEIYVYIVDANNNILHTVKRCGVDYIDDALIERLYFVNDTTNYYYCEITDSKDFDYVNIKFGDGITSKKLELNDRVLIKYAETKGTAGNIESSNTITTFKAPVYDINGVEATLYVTNDDAISDGNDVEDIESIRYNASNLFSTGYRCGGYNDWKVIIENSPVVYKARVWSADDDPSLDTLTTNQNKVFVTAISNSGDDLTTTQRIDLTVDYLKPLKSPTELISWVDLKKLYAIFKGTAVITNLPTSTVTQQIADALDNVYGVLNTDFKTDIASSNFIAIIDNLDSVISHETQIYHMEKMDSYTFANHEIIPSYIASDTTDKTLQVYLTSGSVEIWTRLYSGGIWQDPVKVGYESSSGTITAMSGFVLSSTAVVHNINTVSCTIDTYSTIPVDDLEVALVYRTNDGNGNKTNDMRLPTNDIITDTDSAYNEFTFTYQL